MKLELSTVLYKAISIIFVAMIAIALVRFPTYGKLIIISVVFWLSLRGIVYQKLLVGASLPYAPIVGSKARIISIPIMIISVLIFLNYAETTHLATWVVATIVVFPPFLIALGTKLKAGVRKSNNPT